MEGKPSLTIGGSPLPIRNTFKKNYYYGMQLGLGGAVEAKTMGKTKETNGTRVWRPLGHQKPSRKPKKPKKPESQDQWWAKTLEKTKKNKKKTKFQDQWFWIQIPEPLVLKFLFFCFFLFSLWFLLTFGLVVWVSLFFGFLDGFWRPSGLHTRVPLVSLVFSMVFDMRVTGCTWKPHAENCVSPQRNNTFKWNVVFGLGDTLVLKSGVSPQ